MHVRTAATTTECGAPTDRPEHLLIDGSAITIRPIEPGDSDALAAFHLGLSPEAIHQRFFGSHPVLSERELRRFTHVDGLWRVAFVAIVAGQLVGVGRYESLTDHQRAEVAFVVSDNRHNQGIATLLLDDLVRRAGRMGISELVAEVLGQNHAMIAVLRHSGFASTMAPRGETVLITLNLASAHKVLPIGPSTSSQRVLEELR